MLLHLEFGYVSANKVRFHSVNITIDFKMLTSKLLWHSCTFELNNEICVGFDKFYCEKRVKKKPQNLKGCKSSSCSCQEQISLHT